jgi:Tol biopolymer transport system component
MTTFASAVPTRLSALLASSLGALALIVAQAGAQQVRNVEPRLTRLFGADSLEMSWPAVSPDGRWIVFGTYEAQKGSLWVVSAAGGAPAPLTTGAHNDFNPVFVPSGDRIVFQSDRPSRPGEAQTYVMVMPFDPGTGRGGTPRQVSLEATAGQSLAVSPDGEWIAFASRADTLSRLLAVPSNGGTARTLAEFGSAVIWIQNAVWSGDGRFVYFALRRRATEARPIMRAPLAQGQAQELGSAIRLLRIFPDRGLMLRQLSADPGKAPSYEIATLEGRPVARFATPRNMQLARTTPDGRGMLASQSNIVAPVRVVPVAGGAARQLTEAREYDWPLGWSPNASHVYVSTRLNGHGAVLRLPVEGGPASQVTIPGDPNILAAMSPDGRYVAYTVESVGDARTMGVLRLDDGATHVVTRAAYYGPAMWVTGPGGSAHTNGGEFVYLERRGARLELRSAPPQGPSHLLRAFPASYAGHTGFAVHGSRVAYEERRGDSTAIFVAEGQSGRARLVVTVAGAVTQPVWSHDGRWLALDHYAPGQGSRFEVLLVGVGPDGALAGPPRVIEAGPQFGWQIEWLPDDHAFTVFGMTGAGNETHVFLVSLREGERPVPITRDDPAIRWGYSLSPDGRYVAYPAEIPRGSSLWRVDLGDLLGGSASPRR